MRSVKERSVKEKGKYVANRIDQTKYEAMLGGELNAAKLSLLGTKKHSLEIDCVKYI